ncbi:MAG: serine hydrolase [Candidatus Pseudobacter hemicellulosilyticus]|uniref:Serine hydrolase n=1 Tax=Candidatus Pseudobacter hemicellulosilyticus TaxID=3121375 RepID=A0AAJ6BGL2_9BACT|nr:MAG: serine hydrolase [Pseudobacter sp.]
MRNACWLAFLLLPLSIFGQEALSGKITDEKGRPLAAASVRLNRDGTGTITNKAGLFRLLWPGSQATDSLIVTYLGYQEQRWPLAAFRSGQKTLTMRPMATTLEAVAVTASMPTALQRIQSAIRRIPENYFSSPHITHGFYRIHTRKGEEHLMLSEAVFDVYNPGYASKDKNAFKLVQMRSVQDEQQSHGIDLGLKPQSLYEYDIIRQLQATTLLNPEGLRKHRFQLQGRTLLDGRPVYQISFDQQDGIKESLYKGVLYIDQATEAFVALEFNRSPKGITYARYGNAAERVLLKLLAMQIDIFRENARIHYQQVGGKWVLASVLNGHEWRFRNSRLVFDFLADIRVDYVVTGVDTGNLAGFTARETLGDHRFIEHQDQRFAPDFWKDYNILLADYNTDTIAAIIQRKNERLRLKNQVQARWKKLPENPALKMDSILQFYHQQGQFSGSVLVIHKDQPLFSKGYGLANEASQQPNDSSTQFRIGSLSKSFTTLLLLQLVQENKCRLLDTVGQFIPGYVHGRVTLAQLLSHSSGIPSYTRSETSLAAMLQKEYPLPELVERFGSDPLEFEPGTAFRYSNTGYLVLALVIEKLTGQSLGAALQQRIATPLQLTATRFAASQLNSTGYWMGLPEQPYPHANMAGAGGLSATTTDLARWGRAWRTHQLLSPSLTDSAWEPRFLYTDWDAWYAYGWMVDQHAFTASRKFKVVYHPGTDLGYYCMFVMIPETATQVILLGNHGDFPRYDLAELLLNCLYPK